MEDLAVVISSVAILGVCHEDDEDEDEDTDDNDDEDSDYEASDDDEIDWKLGQIWQIGFDEYQLDRTSVEKMEMTTMMMLMMMVAVATFGK